MKNNINRMIRFFKLFMLIIVATFTTICVLENSASYNNPIEASPGKDKDLEDPDDEDYGGIGVFSYDEDDQTI